MAPRSRALGAALSTLAAGAVLGPGITSAAVPADAAASDSVDLVVGTYNIRAGVSAGTFESAVREFLPRVDVAGLQEVNSKDKEAVLAGLASDGWAYYRDKGPGRGEQEPVMWRKDRFRLLSASAPKISDPVRLGAERPSNPSMRSKYVSVVRLQDLRTDTRLSVINLHLVPGAVKGGRLVNDKPESVRLYKRQLRAVADLTAREKANGAVFVLGDFNAGFVADKKHKRKPLPFRTFKRLGMKSNWSRSAPTKVGTRNEALIDQIFFARKPARTSVVRDVKHSDHRPALATYVFPAGS